jgi:hypothetical protein
MEDKVSVGTVSMLGAITCISSNDHTFQYLLSTHVSFLNETDAGVFDANDKEL